MKQTTALFQTPYGNIDVLKPLNAESDIYKDYVRLTEWIETDYPEIPKETIISNQIIVIDSLIEKEKERAINAMAELNTKKQELLALTHQV